MVTLINVLTALFCGFCALVLVAMTPALFRIQADRRRIRSKGVPVTGTIIEQGIDDETNYIVVEYEYAGTTRKFTEVWMGGKVGKKIPLLVDPDNPDRVVPRGAPARWYIAPAALLCGLAVGGICLMMLLKQFDSPPKTKPTSVSLQYWTYVGDEGKMSVHFTPPTDQQREATKHYNTKLFRSTPREGQPGFVGPPRPVTSAKLTGT